MTYKINPGFDRYPEEGALVGRILSSFGELELSLCQAAQAALNTEGDSVMRALYSLRATSSRIDVAETLMAPIYERFGLTDALEIAVGMIRKCLTLRNQYAHCNWADHVTGGLFFADLQTSAENENFEHFFKHVDVRLLNSQLDFFKLSLEWLRFADSSLLVAQGRQRYPSWPKPAACDPPPPHNPPSEHVPPWISEERKAAHLARALEAEGHGQQQKRPPSVLRLTREEWAAKDAKDAREADTSRGNSENG